MRQAITAILQTQTLALCFLMVPASLAGFQVKSQNPFALMASTPELQIIHKESLPHLTYSVSTAWSNHWFLSKKDDYEKIRIDSESLVSIHRLAFYQDHLQFYIEIPSIHYGGGILDEFISDYHQLMKFPNGDREKFSSRQNLILHQNRTEIRPGSGISDPVLGMGFNLKPSGKFRHALFTRLKIPVADKSELLGNESHALGFMAQHEYTHGIWQFNLQYGFQWQEKHRYFHWKSKDWLHLASFSSRTSLSTHWQGVLQYDYHSALYKNAYVIPATESSMGSIGLIYQNTRSEWQLAVQEDLRVGSTADVSFFIQFKRRIKSL